MKTRKVVVYNISDLMFTTKTIAKVYNFPVTIFVGGTPYCCFNTVEKYYVF